MTDYSLDAYQHDAQRTAGGRGQLALAVSTIKLCGEAGEVAELIGKHLGHGHDLDRDKLRKELGDVLWYLADIAARNELTLAEIAEANIEKLRRRYPDGFDPERSKHRSEP